MGKMICFDMDGTIADLYGVENWLTKLRAEDASPYRDALPLYNMNELNLVLTALSIEGWEIRVISWLSKGASAEYSKAIRIAKREWLSKYHFPADRIHFVAHGTTKANSVRKYTTQAILVDDNAKVRKGWHLGDTINPLDGDLIERLFTLLN